MANCAMCGKPVQGNDHPQAEVSHMACAMESVYAAHGKRPQDGVHAEAYRNACESRAKQVQ